ncbi:hypothetical protein [Pseudomonas sp. B22129]|uniref:hypothetical protein n=1 Tax=Pseudomonas sp. B22129 TaxID=3235111 RepID=UPI003783A716
MSALPNRPMEYLARAPLTKGRPGSRVTFFPSRKNGGPLACGNLLQADYCVHLEYRQDVVTYQCRPPTVCCDALRYKADFLVVLNNGSEVYLKFLPPDAQPRGFIRHPQQAMEAMLQDRNLLFAWLVPQDLPHALVSYNLRYLYHNGFCSSQGAARQARNRVDAMPDHRATVEAMVASGVAIADLSHAIFLDELRINLEQPLTSQTMINGGRDGQL